MSTLTVTIDGTSVEILESKLQITSRVDDKDKCNFQIYDASGTAVFQKGQTVQVIDSNLGTMFSGYVNKPHAVNLYPNPAQLWTVDCVSQFYNVTKHASKKRYAKRKAGVGYSAGVVAADQIQSYLAPDGVQGNFSLSWTEQQTEWQAATLNNAVAATNLTNGNPGGGDLELPSAGTPFTYTGSASVVTNQNALHLSGYASSGYSTAYTYREMWTGSQAIATGDTFSYDVWIASSSPAMMSGVGFVCSDGTRLTAQSLVDQQGVSCAATTDLSGLASDQWYTRTFTMPSALNGKTLVSVQVFLAGTSAGMYDSYFRNILYYITATTTTVTIFGTSSTLTTNIQVSNVGYTNVALSQVTAGNKVQQVNASVGGFSSVNIVQSSHISWSANLPTNCTAVLQTSIDTGVTYQTATSGNALPNLLPGMTSNEYANLEYQVIFTLGSDPTAQPSLSNIQIVINPAYASAKSDVVDFWLGTTDWSSGTTTNLTFPMPGSSFGIILTGSQRNWDDANISSQTLYGASSPAQSVVRKQFTLTTATGNDAKSQLNFAGQWQNFTAEVDVSIPAASVQCGIVYRTTSWVNANDTYAYVATLSTTQVQLGHGSNSGTGAFTSLATASLSLSTNSVHRLKVVVSGSTHQVYVDGVLLITKTDSTYTATGYIGLRVFNSSGSTQTGIFDNFGVCTSLSGTWQSPSIDISGATIYGNSMVHWDINNLPDNTTSIGVQSSLDGGTTWQTVTNGGAISGLTAGESLTGKTLLLLVTLTAQNAPVVPAMNGISMWVMGQYISTGTRSNAPLGNDVYTRANQSGFGTSTDQQTYTKQGSATLAISSNAGTITGTGLTDIQLGSTTATDQSMVSQFKIGNTASLYGVNARYTNASGSITTYRAYVQSGNFVLDKRVSGTVTSLQTVAFALTTGINYKIRLVCQGTTIQARIWLASSTEPSTWQLSHTDSSIASGGVALSANMATSDTATVTAFFGTLYPDPTQYLTGAGRAVNSICDHNSNIPANTRVDVVTSIDGGATYQPIANPGDYIPTLSTAAHYAAIRAKKPLAFYRLNEQSGSVIYDSSNNGNTVSLVQLAGLALGQPGGLQGLNESNDTSILFNGTAGWIDLSTSLNGNGLSAFSFSGWFNLSTTSLGSFTNLISSGTIASHTGYQIYWSSTTALQFVVENGSSGATASYSVSPVAGSWWHIAGTYDGTSVKLYVNGALRATASLTGAISASNPATLGATNAHTSLFPGSIQDVAFFNSTLQQADVTAIYNAGTIATQSVYDDTFTSNTSSQYTQTTGTGGSTATWTWDTANSRIKAVGGSKSVLLWNNVTASDVDLLLDVYQSENGGLIWGWQDASDYYELVVKDAGASSGANTLTLNKISGGSSTQLATGTITFPASTYHRVYVTMQSGVIVAYFDNVQILTYTDGSPLSGQAGLRNDTGTSYIYELQITPLAPDISGLAVYTKHTLTSADPTATPQITDAQIFASDASFGLGASIPTLDYRQTYVSDNFDDLNTQSNYWYSIDFSKNITFSARDASNAPWILQGTDVLTGSPLSVEYSGDLYRNRQTLKGVYQTTSYVEIKTGDGQTRTWNVANPIASGPPTILLNGLPATVGVLNVDTGKQFYYQVASTAITQDNSQNILGDTDSFTITYMGISAIDFTIDNTGQFPGTLSQAQMAALDNTTGVVEAIEDVSQQNMDVAAATTYANQLLQRYGSIARTITFQTLHQGITVGHNLPAFLPMNNIFDSYFLVVEVDTSARLITGPSGDGEIQYVFTVIASEAAALSSWVKLFNKIMRSIK